MAETFKAAVLVGSLRQASLTRRLAKALIRLAPDTLDCRLIEVGELPLYNEDLDAPERLPAPWRRFREEVGAVDAVLFATPEYNRSVPGALKNAIDVGSRPYGKSVWDRKPAAVVSCSPGAMGGFGANHALRQSLVFLNMPVLQQPEAYIGHVGEMVAEDLSIANPGSEKFLRSIMDAFAAWIAKTAPEKS